MDDPAIADMQQASSKKSTGDKQREEGLVDAALEHNYTVYAMNKHKGWSESKIKPLAHFSTLRQFWSMYQHLKRPSGLPGHTLINIF